MFSNFIYFIAAILLYGAYIQGSPPSAKACTPVLAVSCLLACIFFVFEYLYFKALKKRSSNMESGKADQIFTRVSGIFAVSALIIYAAMIYIADVSAYIPEFIKNSGVETFNSLIMISFFMALISIHWTLSYQAYRQIYADSDGVLKYLKSQIMFSIPVIVPWIFLSVIVDIIEHLPFIGLKAWFATKEGDLAFFIVIILLMSFAGPFLIKTAWGCRPLSDPQGLDIITKISDRTGVRFREILEWPLKGGNAITAGVMGVFSRFRFLLVTPALLKCMAPDELGAVISHEAGHVKYRHMMLYLVIIGSFSYVTMTAAKPFEELTLFSGLLGIIADSPGITSRSLSFIPGLFSVVFFIAFIRFVFGYFMRSFERQADAYSFRIMGSASPLSRAFYRIVLLARQDPEKPSWHHYSIKERIDFILHCEADSRKITLHDRKVTISLAVFFICLLVLMFSAHFYEKSELRDHLLENFLLRSIQKQIIENNDQNGTGTGIGHEKISPDNMENIMADYYYLRGSIEKSVHFYEKALLKTPDNPEIMNSLAWIYATAENKGIKNPSRAVKFALKAVSLRPDSAHIWDTLAESHYAAGDYERAVTAGEKAIKYADAKDLDYYRKQLEKFRKNSP
jgi:Zn-dependent protease with chaperone function